MLISEWGVFLVKHQEINISFENTKLKFMIDERINEPSFSDMHTHPVFELFFVFDGEVTVKTEQQNYSVGKNEALLIPPSFYHQTFTKPNTKKSNIYFSFTLRKKSSETEDLYSEFERVFSGIPIIKIDNTYDIGVFITMFQKIVTLNDIGKAERMRSVLTGLFFAIFDTMIAQSSQITSTQKKQKTGLQYHYEIDRLLSTNFMNNISLDLFSSIILNESVSGAFSGLRSSFSIYAVPLVPQLRKRLLFFESGLFSTDRSPSPARLIANTFSGKPPVIMSLKVSPINMLSVFAPSSNAKTPQEGTAPKSILKAITSEKILFFILPSLSKFTHTGKYILLIRHPVYQIIPYQ